MTDTPKLLLRVGDRRGAAYCLKSCLPFVQNTRGVLIHRPRDVTGYKLHKAPHIAVHYFCGNASTGQKNFTFLSAPPDNSIVCERCEAVAVAVGYPSTDELAGRHVHKGRVFAMRTCCAASEVK